MRSFGNQQEFQGMPVPSGSALSTSYLNATGLKDEISLSSPANVQYPLPEWAAFMIWLGWYARNNSSSGVAAFVVLPSRRTACLFAALGAQLAGAQLSTGHLDWKTLAQLPEGTEIYMQTTRLKNKSGGAQTRGVIGGAQKIDGQEFITLKQGSCTTVISVSHVADYIFTLKPTGLRAKIALNGHNKLYSGLVPEFDRRWLLESTSEGLIIGDLSHLKEAAKAMFVGIQNSGNRYPLGDFLGLKNCEDGVSKINAVSDRYDEEVGLSPVCFFNGGHALGSLDHFTSVTGAKSFVAVLERSEYDEQVDQTARRLRGSVDMQRMPAFPDSLLALPVGVECMVFPLSI